ncbi:MAG: prepilin-type N-terminal cleavage/methylation domain-containing protein [Candidatus Eremiobacteraeota bacterium]|nr:prepilin-type N-terminal cleavage/methylation domain-containing protein [Candidatus Eremiobacteraeota bacterium]MCW5871010.1 prepilin-type N-terminal cleavage/methylation domain-containing protein [Candidatus Eremiobacteraeota bacterium]
MRKRAFTLIEIMVVCTILALLATLLAGAYSRYRANLNMVQASARLTAEITNTQQLARSAGQVQMRGGIELAANPLTAATVNNVQGTAKLRIYQCSNDPLAGGLRQVKQAYLLDDTLIKLKITATNLPDVPVVSGIAGDSGLVIEFGVDQGGTGAFQRLFTIPFNPDGTVALPLDTEPARITLDNGVYKRQIEISRVGKVKELRL